jgi:hypothetical protein
MPSPSGVIISPWVPNDVSKLASMGPINVMRVSGNLYAGK